MSSMIAEENVGRIQLLVTDVVMPDMNGRELSEQLQGLCPDLRTLFMSGYTTNIIAHRGVLDDDVSFIANLFQKWTWPSRSNKCWMVIE